jgi:hypothetical protein
MLNPNMFPQMSGPGGASITGEMGMDAVQELNKALTAGYGTDVSTFTGGSALRIQSLDKTMFSTIQENEHFRLFNALVKSNATATVDEWTEQNSIGGRLGGSTNSELGVVNAAQGNYARRVGQVKYLMTRREVSFVATLGNNIVEAEAVEASNGALQLLTDAEFLSFEGDSTVVPTEFDGIAAQIMSAVAGGQMDARHVLDAKGSSLASVNLINNAAANISGYGNFGKPTHMFLSQLTQADFDTGLDPAFRVPLSDVPNGGISLGAPVVGIRTSHGNIANAPDVFIRDQDQLVPYEVLNIADATANVGLKPANVTVAATSDVSSNFAAGQAGNYYWLVTGVNANGESTGFVTAQTAIAAGQKGTLTITASAGGTETGYAVYRGRLNGTNAVTDFRLQARVAKSGATTTYVDLNNDIPGTSKAYILNLSPSAGAITWRQLLPMMKFQFYPTNTVTVPWAQLLFGYLRLAKRRHHVVIKNILPGGAVWRPFNV